VAHAHAYARYPLSIGGDTTKTDKPTPIPKRASASPQPIALSQHPTLDERIDARVKRALYHLMCSEQEINIVSMSYDEFEAFWARVMQEAE